MFKNLFKKKGKPCELPFNNFKFYGYSTVTDLAKFLG